MTLPTTTGAPNTTHNGTGGNGLDPNAGGEVDWVVWVIVSGSLVCLGFALLSYVFLVWLPRRG